MNSLITGNKSQIVTRAEEQPSARIAAILFGKYIAAGSTGFSVGFRHSETDHYMAWFRGDKVTPAQFELIAKTITEAITNNISSQIVQDNNPDARCLSEIEIKPGKDGKDYLIDVMLRVEFESRSIFESTFLDNDNNPRALRAEFAQQVAQIFRKAMKGQLEFDEPTPSFLPMRIAAARVARKFIHVNM